VAKTLLTTLDPENGRPENSLTACGENSDRRKENQREKEGFGWRCPTVCLLASTLDIIFVHFLGAAAAAVSTPDQLAL